MRSETESLGQPPDDRVLRTRLGSRLHRVEYVNLPDANWQLHGPVHTVDFGVILAFEEAGSVGLTWAGSARGGLQILEGDLSSEVTEPVVEDASNVAPWSGLLGRRLAGVRWGVPGDSRGLAVRCAVRLDFEPADSVYVMTGDMSDDGAYLSPCSDTVVLMSGEDARRFVAEHRVHHVLELGWDGFDQRRRAVVLMGLSLTFGGLAAYALYGWVRRLLRRTVG